MCKCGSPRNFILMIIQLALVNESSAISFSELTRVSAALQKQVTRDLEPLWNVKGTVDAFLSLEDVPLGYWPIVVRDDIGRNVAGVHCDENGQPFALVTAEPIWSLTASHEVLEILVNPFGNKLVAGQSPKADQGRVEFLVEIVDPVADRSNAYTVNGVLVSDFYTPHYFDPVKTSGVLYSFRGSISAPRQVLQGGYLSWHEIETNTWWQQSWFGADPITRQISGVTSNCSLRASVDRLTIHYKLEQNPLWELPYSFKSNFPPTPLTKTNIIEEALEVKLKEAHSKTVASSQAKAKLWRTCIEDVIKKNKTCYST